MVRFLKYLYVKEVNQDFTMSALHHLRSREFSKNLDTLISYIQGFTEGL